MKREIRVGVDLLRLYGGAVWEQMRAARGRVVDAAAEQAAGKVDHETLDLLAVRERQLSDMQSVHAPLVLERDRLKTERDAATARSRDFGDKLQAADAELARVRARLAPLLEGRPAGEPMGDGRVRVSMTVGEWARLKQLREDDSEPGPADTWQSCDAFDKVAEQRDSALANARELGAGRDRLVAERDALASELSAAQKMLVQNVKEHQATAAELDALTTERDARRTNLALCRKQREELREKRDALTAELAAVRADADAFEAERDEAVEHLRKVLQKVGA